MKSNQPLSDAEPARFRLRVRYVKRGRLRYLGHLELIHTIERCVRRAALPYAVSQGFSPHMRIGYTSALPVGTGSACEYYDVFLTELVPADEALSRLRAATPEDIAPEAAAYVDLRAPALTARITALRYLVELRFPSDAVPTEEELAHMVEPLYGRGEIPYVRGRKRKSVDVRRTLDSVGYALLPDGRVWLRLDTHCDNGGSLRPEIVIAAFDQVLRGVVPGDEEIVSAGIQRLGRIAGFRIERVAQLAEEPDGTLLPPLPDAPEAPAGTMLADALTNIWICRGNVDASR